MGRREGKKNRFQVKCPSSCLSRPPSCSSHLQYTTTRASWFKHNYQHSNDFFGSWKLDAACGGRGNDQSQRRVVLHRAMTLASPCNLNHPVRIRAMLLSSTRERDFCHVRAWECKIKAAKYVSGSICNSTQPSTIMPNSATGHNVH